jgi:hypothetical protein
MLTHCYRLGFLLILVLTQIFFSFVSAATTLAGIVALPTCGPNPNINTLTLQAAINNAASGSTLVLPSGECVLAKCEIAQGHLCYGPSGGRILSALYVDSKSQLTMVGAADGSSVLKLDPNPPGLPGRHAYCGETHVLMIRGSSFVKLHDFTIDGSDGELPEDAGQCPPDREGNPQRIAERMFDVYVLNSTDVTIDQMRLIKAHGDGLNLMAQQNQTAIPFTERVTVTDTDFLANDRSGIAFQRNVGFVTVRGNYFHNSGEDQDIDMEPSGGPDDRGPYEVDITDNLFDRLRPGITVALGSAGGVQRSRGIRFTYNTIQASSLANPQTGQGGCIFVYTADQTTVSHNTVIGAQRCVTVAAQKVADLVIEQNHLEGYVNVQNSAGQFVPRAVVDVSERVVNRGDTRTCGPPPKPPCPYFIHYPDQVTVRGNTIVQHVRNSLGVRLSNIDGLGLADNTIEFTNKIAPVGTVTPVSRATGIYMPFGVQNLPSYGYYVNERTLLKGWSLSGNNLNQFADGVKMKPLKAGVLLSAAAVNGNLFTTNLPAPRGLYLEGAPAAPQSRFINALMVNFNRFGCGFPSLLPPFPPPHAYVRPSGQTHTGNIGLTIPCR